jgi:cyclophilin family peptidyl-prolyl cis-trans isomerase
VQFGLAADPKMTAQFTNKNLRDEPVRKSNQKGKITFATSGPNTRTTQLFINFGDNANLDQMGFTPFGEVVFGMENVEKITAEYGEQPDQSMIKQEGTAYLNRDFPNLDMITTVSLVK